MADVQLKVMVDGEVTQTISLTRRDEDNPFSSGKQGYNASEKIVIDGRRHQAGINLVEIADSKGSSKNGPVTTRKTKSK